MKGLLIAFTIMVTALTGSVFAVWQFGAANIQMQGLLITAQLAPAVRAQTIVDIPPFGEVVADTHRGPVKFTIRLERIETEAFTTKLEHTSSIKKYFIGLKNDFSAQIKLFFLRQILIAMLGALIVLLAVWRLRFWRILKYSLFASLIFTAFLSLSFYRYDFNAFSEPEYRGTLTMAPKVIEIANDSLANLDKLKMQASGAVANIKRLFASADGLAGLSHPDEREGSIAVLLVSDLHTNPIGVEFMKAIVQQFRVDMVVNAGDLSDLGSMPEASLIAQLSGLGVPQVLVSGNHDTDAIMASFAVRPEIHVAVGRTIEVMGLKVLGWPDALSGTGQFEYTDQRVKQETLDRQAQIIRTAVQQQGTPDILVVHNESVASKLVDLAPLVVTGHTHRMKMLRSDGHTLINPGTIGAAGLRGLSSEAGVGYSAAIVYIKPGVGPLMVDMIRYKPDSQQFLLERQVLLYPAQLSDKYPRENQH